MTERERGWVGGGGGGVRVGRGGVGRDRRGGWVQRMYIYASILSARTVSLSGEAISYGDTDNTTLSLSVSLCPSLSLSL